VAPPYPGAFTDELVQGGRLALLGSHYRGEAAHLPHPALYVENGRIYADCADSQRFEVLKCALNDQPLTAASLAAIADGEALLLGV
jgi:hypothetical protein